MKSTIAEATDEQRRNTRCVACHCYPSDNNLTAATVGIHAEITICARCISQLVDTAALGHIKKGCFLVPSVYYLGL